MEKNQQILPRLEPATNQEEEDSNEDSSNYSSILPFMPHGPSQQRAAPQAAPSPFTQMQHQDYAAQPPPPGYVSPLATYPAESGNRIGAEQGNLGFSSSSPLLGGHYAYPAAVPSAGTGGYMPALGADSSAGKPPIQSYPGYEPYQPLGLPYGYDSSGQGYPAYGTSASMPYSSHGAADALSQASYAASQILPGTYPGMGSDQTYGGAKGHNPYYGSGYPQQPPQTYQGQPSIGNGYYGAPPNRGRGRGHQHQNQGSLPKQNKSYATKPGKPYYNDKNRSGPDGANLFVFYIPNDMTNNEMFGIFGRFGTVLSARIMTEEGTGRGKGFGFISYDSAASAASAIHHLNGYQIRGKRLMVAHKKQESRGGLRTPSPGFALPMQEYSMPPSQQHDYSSMPPAQPHQLLQPEVRQFVPASGFGMPAQDNSMPSPQPPQLDVRRDEPAAALVPVQKDATGPSEAHENVVRQDQPSPAGILPVQEHASGPPKTHVRRGSTPVLPPIDADSTPVLPPILNLSEGTAESGDDQDDRSSPTLPSPLDDLQGIGNALPLPAEE